MPVVPLLKILLVCGQVTSFEEWKQELSSAGITLHSRPNFAKNHNKAKEMAEWEKQTGVYCISSYTSNSVCNGLHRLKDQRDNEEFNKDKAKYIRYLLNPGPQMVIFDDGKIAVIPGTMTHTTLASIIAKYRILLLGGGQYSAAVHDAILRPNCQVGMVPAPNFYRSAMPQATKPPQEEQSLPAMNAIEGKGNDDARPKTSMEFKINAKNVNAEVYTILIGMDGSQMDLCRHLEEKSNGMPIKTLQNVSLHLRTLLHSRMKIDEFGHGHEIVQNEP